MDQLGGERPTKQIRLVHDGEFGFTAKLRIYVGTEYEGQYGNLFWYRNGRCFSYIDSGIIDAEGYVTLTMSHASDYVIVVDRKEMSTNDIQEALRYSGNTVQTGDPAALVPLCGIFVLAFVTMILMIRRKHIHIG